MHTSRRTSNSAHTWLQAGFLTVAKLRVIHIISHSTDHCEWTNCTHIQCNLGYITTKSVFSLGPVIWLQTAVEKCVMRCLVYIYRNQICFNSFFQLQLIVWNWNGILLKCFSSTIYYFSLKAFLEISFNPTADKLSLKLLYFLNTSMAFSDFNCLCSIVYSEINAWSEVLPLSKMMMSVFNFVGKIYYSIRKSARKWTYW